MSFEKLFDEIDELNDLLNEGPDGDKSDEFLRNCRMEAQEIARLLEQLTVADVDAEFTEESEDQDGEEEGEEAAS